MGRCRDGGVEMSTLERMPRVGKPLPVVASQQYLLVGFFFNDTATTEIYTLSLHDALPISGCKSKWDFSELFSSEVNAVSACSKDSEVEITMSSI